MSCLDMAIWVSKDALLPQECRQMKQCMNGFNGLKSKNTDFQNFCIFVKFPLYNVMELCFSHMQFQTKVFNKKGLKTEFAKRIKMVVFRGDEDYIPPWE